jgi:murein DD-endopeptidase MepM/ murein hydrolase activator NlpD
MRICPPVFPYAGLRGVDAWGAGGFLSPRDAGARQHYGLDFIGKPGDQIVAPISGVIDHFGFMYADSPEMRNIWIFGTGEYEHYRCMVGYVEHRHSFQPGAQVEAGVVIGELQDVAAYWQKKLPDRKGTMRNHCHLGLKIDGVWVNPGQYLPKDLPTC